MNKRRRYTAKRRRAERHKVNERDRKAKPTVDLFFDSDALPEQLDVSRDLVWDKLDLDDVNEEAESFIYNRSQEINEQLEIPKKDVQD